MSRKLLIPLGLVVWLAAAPALAEEILYFTNGTTMAVESHSIEEGTVRVDLGDQAFMEFPLEQIEKIESATGQVQLPRPGANRMVPRSGTQAAISTGSVPSRMRRSRWRDRDPVSTADDAAASRSGGVAAYHPFGPGASKSKQRISVTGRQRPSEAALGGNSSGDLVGTSRVGARNSLPPSQSGVKRQPAGMMARGGGAPPPKPKPKPKND